MHAVVLDLDNTLVHTTEGAACAGFDHFVVRFEGTNRYSSLSLVVHIRPHALHLMRVAHDDPSLLLVVWTAGTRQYATQVVAQLFLRLGVLAPREECILAREDTVEHSMGLLKDLDVVRTRLGVSRATLVDDNATHATLPSNANSVLTVPPFYVHNAFAALDAKLLAVVSYFQKEETTVVVRPKACAPSSLCCLDAIFFQ